MKLNHEYGDYRLIFHLEYTKDILCQMFYHMSRALMCVKSVVTYDNAIRHMIVAGQ